eukprot:CAMPEP_0170081144 /NCGR_PEP_ID=MMETSP0019_2-20121128/17096_1 /TAXON_ID=98059 /ORGANISM="Dinobryon sp., Strain UTEXLB2267" /LENGTH=195 /DNA_ID=CAMNT_0010295449 /DNA_START=235 /DNA_END=822 /DNA_ORIENTATION=+
MSEKSKSVFMRSSRSQSMLSGILSPQRIHAVQPQPVHAFRHLITPAAVSHDLAAEVQLEEELVHQPHQLTAGHQLQHQRDLHRRGVYIQLEGHEVLFAGSGFDVAQRTVRVGDVAGDGHVEEVVDGLYGVRHALPELARLQQRVLPAIKLVEYDASLVVGAEEPIERALEGGGARIEQEVASALADGITVLIGLH